MAKGFLPETWAADLQEALALFGGNEERPTSIRQPLMTWQQLLGEGETTGQLSRARYAVLEEVTGRVRDYLVANAPPLGGASWPHVLVQRLQLLARQQQCLQPD